MSRAFVRQVQPGDEYPDKLVKLIPAGIVAVYLAIQANLIVLGERVVVGAIVVLLIFHRSLPTKGGIENGLQVTFSTLSLLVWVYSVAPVEILRGLYNPPLASVILALWTLGIPFVKTDALTSGRDSGGDT